jgi:thioredoxin reductase
MPPTTTTHAPAVVIGAGPYGLSVAAHLRGRGIAVRTFGDVMSGWHSQMPAGMFLKSTPSASSLSAPGTGSRLEDFCIVSGVTPLVGDDVVPIDLFIRYGQWFAERNVPDVENVKVTGLKRDGHLHLVTLATGEQISTPVVVLATGMSGAAHVAPELSALGEPAADGVLSHSSQHTSLDGFAGREVAVIGAGQSALENAALLHEAGARVQIISRSPVVWGGDPVVREGVSRYLPDATRLALVRRVLGPFGAWWLKPRVVGQFDVHEGQRVTSARAVGDNALLTTTSVTGHQSEFKFDHVLSATGFRVNLANLGFMDPALMSQFRSIVGCPRLSGSFESSVPGIYFAGLAASSTFGPLMRFVCGAEFAAGKVTNSAAARIRAVSRM